MSKKVLGMILALMMILMLLPAAVYADGETTEYQLWIGGTQVTSENADDVLGDGTVRFENSGDKNILTLSDANITGSSEQNKNTFNIISQDIDLTMKLAGENRVGDGNTEFAVYSINGSLTIEGSGSLDAVSSRTCIDVIAGDLIITGGTVNATGGRSGILTLDLGTGYGDITITDGTVTGTGKELYGIAANGSLTITGGTVAGETLNSDGADSENPFGGISAGNGITIGEGLIITVPAENAIGELQAEDGNHFYVLEGGKPAQKVVIAPEFPIWVGGTQVTKENADDVLGDGTVRFAVVDGKNILTLNNADITGTYKDESDTYNICSNSVDLEIELIGENKVGDGSASFAIDTWYGDLIIGGDGSLTTESSWSGIVAVEGSITIMGVTVSSTGLYTGIAATENGITIKDSIVYGKGIKRNGLHAVGDITVINSTVTGETEAEGGFSTYGIPLGGIGTYGGNIIIEDGLNITDPAGGSIGEVRSEGGEYCYILDGEIPAQKAVIEPIS